MYCTPTGLDVGEVGRLSRSQGKPGALREQIANPVVAVDFLDRGAQLETVEAGLQEVGPIEGEIGLEARLQLPPLYDPGRKRILDVSDG